MKTIFCVNKFIIGIFILLTPFICFASPQGKIEVKGVKIISDGYGTDIDALKPFNQFKGTSIACLVTLPNGGIIKFDKEQVIIELHNRWSDPNSVIVKRMNSFSEKFPEILKPILES